ncbi:MAG TPA: phosphatase PAP2 family protein [Candidatus Thermoplasmatota archaeon]|nr:phosphatase PAP2 family protein [Candidatus Thermoplasmatota archaeon]
MALSLGTITLWTVLAATPLGLWWFERRRWPGGVWANMVRLATHYTWNFLLFAIIVAEKTWVDSLNDRVRGVFGDRTWLLWKLEGPAAYHVQQAFEAPWLTAFLNVHYLWVYVFLTYFAVLLWAYRDDRELADLASLTYSIIYLLAVPFYIFFNVQVTSRYIPGMRSLLYNAGPGWHSFFLAHDPLDNAFPSLHIAIPFGLICVAWWTMRRRGYTLRDWEHRGFLWFLIAKTALFAFSILYLGIHWITDIPGGILVGLLGATIADEFRTEFARAFTRLQRVLGAPFRWAFRDGGRLRTSLR